ncbi:MAG: phage tail protein, partial [Hafnia sp.]
MGKLTETDKWEDDVYQLETSDPVLGGPEGISNKASRQLANRTFWLKKRLEQANEALAQHAQSRDHPDGTLNAKGFVQLSSVTGSDSETLAATPKAIKIAMENANARLAKDRNGADIPNPRLFVSNLGLDDTIDKAANAWPTAVRGTLRNNGAFANCTLVGVYHVAISDASTVADAPAIDGAPISLYGFLYVTNEAAQYSQLFISNYGHIAARVAWNGTGSYRAWSVSYTTTNKQPLPYASLTVSGIVQLSSATDSASEALAATPKAIKIAMDNANARLAKERNG